VVSGLTLLILYTLIVLWILSFIFLFRKKISCMAGMMVAMTVGMVLGLAFGTIIAILHPDHFFEVTVISILFGALAGTIAGFPISIMAVLDGFLSGAMGGMMGAMLGVMVSGQAINNVMNVMIVLAGGVLFILFLMMQGELSFKEKDWKNFFFAKRLPLFLVILLAFYLTHHFSLPIEHEKMEEDHSSHHKHQMDED
jgi:MFS family permease